MNNTRVRELMTTNVVTLDKQQAIPLAQELMRMMHVRHLPVVGDDGNLVGMVTHRSLLAAQVEMLSQMASAEDEEKELTIPVAKVMKTDVLTVDPDASVSEALKKMLDAKQGVVVVVEERHIVGVLTSRDFLECQLKQPDTGQVAVEQVAKLAATEAAAQVTARVVRNSATRPVAPRWIVWFLATLVVLLVLVLIVHHPAPITESRGQAGCAGSALLPKTSQTTPDLLRGRDDSPSGFKPVARIALRQAEEPSSVPVEESPTPQPEANADALPRARRSTTTEMEVGEEGPPEPSALAPFDPDPADSRQATGTAPIAPGEQLPLPGSLEPNRPRGGRWIPEPTRIPR